MPQRPIDRIPADILDAQPGLHRRSWWRDNWMAFAMFVAWVLAQVYAGSGWLHARENDQLATKQELAELREQLRKVPDTYVRQDVFTQVLVNINQRLTSIDNKLSAERR